MRFTQQDFEGALDFVRDLYDQRGLADFADRTMGSLLRIVGAERVIYGDFKPGAPVRPACTRPFMPSA